MKVLEIDDTDMKEKGYATITLDLTEEEINFLIEYAIIDILRKGIENENNFCTTIPSP